MAKKPPNKEQVEAALEGVIKQRPPKPTEDELGMRFIKEYRTDFSYIYSQWHTYGNGVWKTTETEHMKASWETIKKAKAVGIRPSNSLAENVLKYASLFMRPEQEAIDHRTYINLENGVYNLNTLQLEPHTREMYFTSQLPFAYDPAARCPTWERFLAQSVRKADGETDYHLIGFIREAFGYSLTANTDQRLSFWLLGPSGTGKSTLINVLIALAGDSHTSIDMKFLGKNEYQLADLVGKRVITFAEPDANTVLSDGDYKRLVSQDVINARNPYGRWIRFVPEGKVWGAMNHLPAVSDRSDGVFNRVCIVPMNHVVSSQDRDPQLIEKLLAELPGIFNWSMEGWDRLKERGFFILPPTIQQANSEWRNENDTEAAFVEDWCIRDKSLSTQASDLYAAYKWWCDRNGYRAKSSRKAARDWERLGFPKLKNNTVFYNGVGLRPENERE